MADRTQRAEADRPVFRNASGIDETSSARHVPSGPPSTHGTLVTDEASGYTEASSRFPE